jgi:hypothetical protein
MNFCRYSSAHCVFQREQRMRQQLGHNLLTIHSWLIAGIPSRKESDVCFKMWQKRLRLQVSLLSSRSAGSGMAHVPEPLFGPSVTVPPRGSTGRQDAAHMMSKGELICIDKFGL